MPTYLIFIIIGAVIFIIFFLYLFYMKRVFNEVFVRHEAESFLDADLSKTHYAPYVEKIRKNYKEAIALDYQDLWITSFDGLKLYGQYYDNKSDKTVIFVHGVFATPYNNFATQILAFKKHGFNMLVINQRAHGKSEGKYLTFGVYEAKDLDLWIKKIEAEFKPKSIVLYGTSLGGATVVTNMGYYPNDIVKMGIDDSGFLSLKSVARFKLKKAHIPLWIVYPIERFYSKIFAHVNVEKITPSEAIKLYNKPMIFIHSRLDDIVAFSDGETLYNNFQGEKLKFFTNNAGHTSVFLANQTDIEDELFRFITEKIA